MKRIQVYLRKEELDALRQAAAHAGQSVSALVREAIRIWVPKPRTTGPIALWAGKPRRASLDHDSVHDSR
jgi:hypothetical protein